MKKMTSIIITISILSFILAGCNFPANAENISNHTDNFQNKIENIQSDGDGKISCTYNETARTYIESMPSDTTNLNGIIFMFHGYGGNAESFSNDTGFNKNALKRNYGVIYINGLPDPLDKTSAIGFNSGISESDIDDIGFVKSLASYYQDKFNISKDRTFAAGFSNGAFMTLRIAMEGSDYFGSVASVAGMMSEKIWNEREIAKPISILQINGTKDDVVPMNLNGTAKYSKAPAIEDVISYFSETMKLEHTETIQLSKKSTLTKYSSDSSKNKVWHVLITDGRHSWPSMESSGFDTNELILDFFE